MKGEIKNRVNEIDKIIIIIGNSEVCSHARKVLHACVKFSNKADFKHQFTLMIQEGITTKRVLQVL